MKTCAICNKEFAPVYNTTQKVCSQRCAIEQVNLNKEKKQQREINRFNKSAKKDRLDFNRSDLTWQHKQTRKAFNKMRVLEEIQWFRDRGLEPECISCGREKGNDMWSCGHLKTVGSQGNLRDDRKNTYLQHLTNCNKHLSGDIAGTKKTRGYLNGLRERFGEVEGQAIIDYCETHTETKKWTCEELEALRRQFNQRIRELERG